MINMLRADFYRLIKSKGVYIAMLILLIMISLCIYAVQPFYIGISSTALNAEVSKDTHSELDDMSREERQNLSVMDYREIMLKAEGYKLDVDILSTNANLYYFFIFIVVFCLTVDFSGGSVKNTLSSAISRNKYYLAKLSFISFYCMAIFFLNTYIVYFANILFNNENIASSLGTVTKISLLQLPPILALASILTGIGFMVKRTAVFNTITIPLIIVFQVILNIAVSILKIKEEYLYYELQLMIGKLANNPSGSYVLHSYLVCAVIIIAFNVLGYLAFIKAEIK